jgi:septal ring factor EnvC (AmiA/AmiB activator)
MLAAGLMLFSVSSLTIAKDSGKTDSIIRKDKKRLDKYKGRIKEHEVKVEKIKSKEKSVFKKMRRIQTLLDNKKTELKEAAEKKDNLDFKIKTSKEDIIELKEKAAGKREQLKKRMVALYKFSDMQYLKILFSSSSYVDILKRYKCLKLILNQDSELIYQYNESERELEIKTDTLKKEKEMLDEIIKKVKNKEKEVLAERNSKRILLLKVKREKSSYLKALKELNGATRKLEELILKFQKEASSDKISYKEKFGDFKGVLEPPVNSRVISFFGKEQVSRLDSYLFNNGIRFSTEIGQAVKSVFGGEVIYSDWFRGYGKLIIIDHGSGYYTIYSHLSELLKSVGNMVNRGDLIAQSGDTGSLMGQCLYFEIRFKGRSQDPLDWLEPTINISRAQNKIR